MACDKNVSYQAEIKYLRTLFHKSYQTTKKLAVGLSGKAANAFFGPGRKSGAVFGRLWLPPDWPQGLA
jgi:hypothetical protein